MVVIGIPYFGFVVPLHQRNDSIVVADQAAQLAGDGPLPGRQGMPILFLGHRQQLLHAGPTVAAGEDGQALTGRRIGPLQQLANQGLVYVMGLAPAKILPRGCGPDGGRRGLGAIRQE